MERTSDFHIQAAFILVLFINGTSSVPRPSFPIHVVIILVSTILGSLFDNTSPSANLFAKVSTWPEG